MLEFTKLSESILNSKDMKKMLRKRLDKKRDD